MKFLLKFSIFYSQRYSLDILCNSFCLILLIQYVICVQETFLEWQNFPTNMRSQHFSKRVFIAPPTKIRLYVWVLRLLELNVLAGNFIIVCQNEQSSCFPGCCVVFICSRTKRIRAVLAFVFYRFQLFTWRAQRRFTSIHFFVMNKSII